MVLSFNKIGSIFFELVLQIYGIATYQINWMKNVSSSIDNAYNDKIPAFACYHIPSLDFKTAFESEYGFAADEKFNLDINGHSGDFGRKNENVSLFNVSLASELKSANSELERELLKRKEIDEMRTEFISNVSHELRTPIAVFEGYVNMLARWGNKLIIVSA